jgi:hypothetical protein
MTTAATATGMETLSRGGIESSQAGSWLGSVRLAKLERSLGSAWCCQMTEKWACSSARQARGSLELLDEPDDLNQTTASLVKNPQSPHESTLLPPSFS